MKIKAKQWDRIIRCVDALRHESTEDGFEQGKGTRTREQEERRADRKDKAYEKVFDAIRALESGLC